MLVDLETHGTRDHFLPALVVGYDVSAYPNRYLVEQAAGVGDWLLLVSPQVGGMGMSYPQLMGTLLRLEQRNGIAPLLRGLRAMGEDPDRTLLKTEYPDLV